MANGECFKQRNKTEKVPMKFLIYNCNKKSYLIFFFFKYLGLHMKNFWNCMRTFRKTNHSGTK